MEPPYALGQILKTKVGHAQRSIHMPYRRLFASRNQPISITTDYLFMIETFSSELHHLKRLFNCQQNFQTASYIVTDRK